MFIKTLLCAVGALALAACDHPTEPMTADAEAKKVEAAWLPYGLPDLIVTGLTHVPANPITGDVITFTAVVRNSGIQSAGPSKLEFRIGGETPGSPQTRFAVPALASGQTLAVKREMVLTAQNYRNTATADVANAVAESYEWNNVRTDNYTVAQADQRNAVDQAGSWMLISPDNPGVYAMKVAQVVTGGVAGALVQVRLPVNCPSYASGLTSVVVEIQGVTSGKPNGTILASQTVPAATLLGSGTFAAVEKDIMFSSPASFAAGDRFAIVLSAVGQWSCSIKSAYAGVDYAGGQGFIKSRGINTGWSDWLPSYAPFDLAFVTAVRR
jgi:hypothetical protein